MFRRVAWRSEQGISTVIVAVSLIGLIGAVMLSVDYGNTVQTRRNLITGTDATALDRARIEVGRIPALVGPGPIDCPENTWTDYLTRNVGAFDLSGIDHPCRVYPNGTTGTGYVVIEARKTSDTRFGGLFGIGDTHPYSMSVGQYGFTTGARGLRPMGFCNQNGHIKEWLNATAPASDGGTKVTIAEVNAWYAADPSPNDHPIYPGSGALMGPGYPDAGAVHRMWFQRLPGDGPCGGTSGNWGWMDYNCTPADRSSCGNGNPSLAGWIADPGYQGLVNLWQPNPPQPPPGDQNGNGVCDISPNEVDPQVGCVNGTDGMRLQANGETQALNALVASGEKFHVPIFRNVTGTGNNSRFEIYGFLGVRLWGYQKIGSNGYFDLEFFELLLDGSCCSSTPEPGSQPGVKLCEVDHDASGSDAQIASRCGQ